jgi:predicted nucleic acid-binding protein
MSDRFVVDASVVMTWCFQDEQHEYGDKVLDSLGNNEALVPGIWPLEVGNVLLVAERRKRLSEARIVSFLDLLSTLPITVERDMPQRMLREIIALAREQGLTTYDASYLDLAMRLALPLATLDSSLARAAKKCRVPGYSP